jgi:hypothetical protein
VCLCTNVIALHAVVAGVRLVCALLEKPEL